jgi:beta-lactamase class A
MLVLDGVQRRGPAVLDLSNKDRFAMATTVTQTFGIDGIKRQPAAMTAAMPAPRLANLVSTSAPEPNYDFTADTTLPSDKLKWLPYAAIPVALATVAMGLVGLRQMQVRLVSQSAVTSIAATQPAQRPAQPDPDPAAAQAAALQTTLNEFTSQEAATFGIYVKDLKTGAIASHNAEKVFTSASFYKLFVAQQLYQAAERGETALNPRTTSCLQLMINVSSNECGAELGERLGWGRQDASLKTQGYAGTSLKSLQQTSAQDVALLLERLYHKENLAAANADQFMQFLKEQRVNNRLPQGLPPGTVFAHKTGDLFGYMHDGGIVFGPKTDYLIVVMSGPWSKPGQAPSRFADLSAKLFAQLN